MALAINVSAQATNVLEFSSASGSTASGPTVANQVDTLVNNSSNNTAWTFSSFSTPTTLVTFSLSNQQYTLPTTQNPTGYDVNFGATVNNSGSLVASWGVFTTISDLSSPSASNFSSTATSGQAGTGISTSLNYVTEIFTSAMGMYNAGSPTGSKDSFYMADLTVTFSRPLTNPILHIVGLGGYSGNLGFTTELMLATSGVTLSELSGSKELKVTSTQILNSATVFSSTTGSGAASGSVLVTGTAITSLVFHLYMKGDGKATSWATTTSNSGDGWMIGVSIPNTIITLPVIYDAFTASSQKSSSLLQWTTESEVNTDHFEIQRSEDAVNWDSIGQLKAEGNSELPQSYLFTDASPLQGSNYYRIKEVSQDGTIYYSKVQEVSFSSSSTLSFYPNPVSNRITVIFADAIPQTATLVNIIGQPLQQFDSFMSGQSIDLSRYPRGIYLLSVRSESGESQVLKILKN